jgi:cell division septal protein FtsQ
VLLALLVFASYRATWLVRDASLFRVDHIQVRGNERLSTGEVLALVTGLRGQSLLGADLTRYRARLLDSPWIADAALRRVLPSSVDVLIAERVPIALGRIGSRLYLIDERGTLIDEYGPQYVDFDLPIVDGLTDGADDGSKIDRPRMGLVARLLVALAAQPVPGRRVSQIDVSDAHDAVVLLEGETTLIHLGEERLAERLRSYVELAPALHDRVPDIDYVDLRFDERVYIRPGEHNEPAAPATRPH